MLRSRPRLPLILRIFLLLLLLGACQREERILRPEAANWLEQAVQGAGLTLQQGQVQEKSANLQVCLGNDCAPVTLTDAQQPCVGQHAGVWCVQLAPTPWQPQLLAALAKNHPETLWKSVPLPDRGRPLWLTWLLALAWLLLPLILGLLLAKLAKTPKRVLLILLVFSLLLTLLLVQVPRLGAGDTLGLLALLTFSALVNLHAPWQKRALLLTISLMLGLGLLEGIVHFLPPPPAFPPPETALLFLPEDPERMVDAALDPVQICHDLYEAPPPIPHLQPSQRAVLHLGDSLAAGAGVPENQRFDAQIHLPTEFVQVNRAIAGSSIDVQYLLAKQILPQLQTKLVVLHIFDGNDINEVGRHYSCCAGQSLLVLPSKGQPIQRCTQAVHRQAWHLRSAWLAASPPPFPLRVLTSVSPLAGHLASLWIRAVEWWTDVQPLPVPERVAQYRVILLALRDLVEANHAQLLVVGMPLRRPLGQPRPQPSAVQVARELGLDVIDADPRIQDAVLHGAPLFLAQSPVDPHLNAAGHHVLAEWLGPQILERLAR